MTREVRFLDETVAELHDAAAWYQARSEGLGLVFLGVIDAAVDVISRWPGSGALVDGASDDLDVRRTTIARFPGNSHTWLLTMISWCWRSLTNGESRRTRSIERNADWSRPPPALAAWFGRADERHLSGSRRA